MFKVAQVALIALIVVSCKNQANTSSVETTTSVERPEVTPSRVFPDQARVEILVLNYSAMRVEAKVIRLIEVGHSFKDVLTNGQLIEFLTAQNLEIQPDQTLECIIEKNPEEGYWLVSHLTK